MFCGSKLVHWSVHIVAGAGAKAPRYDVGIISVDSTAETTTTSAALGPSTPLRT